MERDRSDLSGRRGRDGLGIVSARVLGAVRREPENVPLGTAIAHGRALLWLASARGDIGKGRSGGSLMTGSSVTMRYAAITNTGLQRDHNEDGYLLHDPAFLVVDGLGGHERGDIASEIICATFSELDASVIDDPDVIGDLIQEANRRVLTAADEGGVRGDMGATMVGLFLLHTEAGIRWLIANVGDSRLYRLTGGSLLQVTTDHSMVEEMVAAGVLAREDARTHPHRNVITRAVGMAERVEVDFGFLDVLPGDRFLICSDGVHTELDDDELLALLLRGGDPDETVASMEEAILSGDARDNFTALVVDVESSSEGLRRGTDDTSPLPIIPVVAVEPSVDPPLPATDLMAADLIAGVPEAIRTDALPAATPATGERVVISVPDGIRADRPIRDSDEFAEADASASDEPALIDEVPR